MWVVYNSSTNAVIKQFHKKGKAEFFMKRMNAGYFNKEPTSEIMDSARWKIWEALIK